VPRCGKKQSLSRPNGASHRSDAGWPVACKKFLAVAAVIVTLSVPIWSSFEKPAGAMDEGGITGSSGADS
jgi:hypothetical protein